MSPTEEASGRDAIRTVGFIIAQAAYCRGQLKGRPQVKPDPFTHLRRLVLRRAIFAVNVHALQAGTVSPDGAFDAAAANALAALVSYRSEGSEYAGDRVKTPSQLIKDADQLGHIAVWLPEFAGARLSDAIRECQKFRHGRADDEWAHLDGSDIAMLAHLDTHPALQVLELTRGHTFDEAVRAIWDLEVADNIGWDPSSGLTSDSIECPDCGRFTLVVEGIDIFGLGPGEGCCIACGHERTYEHTVEDAFDWRIGEDD